MSSHITPTGYAEEVYQAKLDAKFDKARVRGPSGIWIPAAKSVFRKTVDGPLLAQMIKVSYADYRKRMLPQEMRAAVATRLREDVLRRFPADDMAVLERYKAARPFESAVVEILAGVYEPAEHLQLLEPVLLPVPPLFHVDLGGHGGSTHVPVPADVVPFFCTVLEVRRQKLKSFDPANQWPGFFRTKEGRWPRWFEIERQFPLIGEWIEGQRNG